MASWTKRIIMLYLIIVLLKILLASFILAPSAFSDDYGYAKTARDLFYYGTLTEHGTDLTNRPPLYSIILSVAYIFKDMEIVYFLMKVLNALLSSLIIMPAWLLSREFFSEKKSFFLTAIIALLPANFGFTYFLMAENLFYPLFIFSIYLIHKSFTENSYKWDIIAGMFIGLSYLTKINALILPIIVAFVFFFKMFKQDYKEISKKSVMAISFLVTISPWLIRNSIIFGFNKAMILGSYDQSLNLTTSLVSSSIGEFLLIFLTWVVIHIGYLIIASGFLFFTSSFFLLHQNENKNAKILFLLTFSSALLLVFIASRNFRIGLLLYQTNIPWLAGRIIGRYVEAVIPLIFISGLLGLKYMKKTYWPYYTVIPILIVSSQLVFFQLFPINNMSLVWLGGLKLILDFLIHHKFTFEPIFSNLYSVIFIIILIVIFLSVIYLQKKLSTQKLLYFFIIFFFAVNLLNFAGGYYNSYNFWYKGEQTQLGLWFNKYDPEISTVLFDERDGCKIVKTNQTCIYNPFRGGGSATLIGFWMNDNIKIGSVDDLEGVDYVVSRHILDLSLIRETENGIFLYKVDKGQLL